MPHSRGQVGSGSEIPRFPYVSSVQFSTMSCMTNRNAIVRITNEWPRVRMMIGPTAAAKSPATIAEMGTK